MSSVRSEAQVRTVGALALVAGIAGWILGVGITVAQISPGPLSSPHTALEGTDRCLECHSQKQRIAPSRCLECHELLRERLDDRKGFHATVTDQGCERCHMEHHGAEFELIYWGEEGVSSFDHQLTGFALVGAHSRLECRSCHKPSLIRDRVRFESAGKNLDRTFLGLDGSRCLNCHRDEHEGQFSNRTCTDCHGIDRWKPVDSFDHSSTRFPLVGEHRRVTCDRCHVRDNEQDPDATTASSVRYANLPHSTCTDCHRDPHQARLGQQCQQCHSEQGWRVGAKQGFDHGRARFALIGAHREVRCEACHVQGLSRPIVRFQRCSDCHADWHLGQFDGRSGGKECDACHDIGGFRPARFGPAEHQDSTYPLAGAHQAVACNACHVPLTNSEIESLSRASGTRAILRAGREIHRYSLASELCVDCHRSPHESSLERFMQVEGCLTCHSLSGWRHIDFDHERTDYSLFGGHLDPSCRECHRARDGSEPTDRMVFADQDSQCETCHRDPHRAQFRSSKGEEPCSRCHSTTKWSDLRFDHNEDSQFTLDGVHLEVRCSECHRIESDDLTEFVRYKPLPRDCVDCHSGPLRGRGGG